MYEVILTKVAQKELLNIPKIYAAKIYNRLEYLKTNPLPYDVVKLKGIENTYRTRVADYRIVYELFRDKLIIKIIKIQNRKEVYRKR